MTWALLALCGALWALDGLPPQPPPTVEIVRDRWGVPHIFAETEEAAFYGLGYATAQDRILQMDLFRRRARGRLAEVFGARMLDSDREFRIAGVSQYCDEAAANLPGNLRAYLRAYAAGVNAWVLEHPEEIRRRFAAYPVQPQLWTEGDCVCAWMAVATLFDKLYDAGPVSQYHAFRARAAEVGEEAALAESRMVMDDWAAVVPESEMAKEPEIYHRLKSTPPTPGYQPSSTPDEMLTFSHAWAIDGSRSVTGKPLLESDPQTSVNNPPLWYEFHLSAGRFNVRGIGVAGSPGLLIGFNERIAWGLSALGAHATVTFLEKPSGDGRGYWYQGRVEPLDVRTEIIDVRGSKPVELLVRRTRHGFVFNELVSDPGREELYVSHCTQLEQRQTTLRAMLEMMAARNWTEFRQAMEHWYSPGVHVVYADVDGNIGYHTLLYAPLTRRTRRLALEGWTGEDEILGRIPLELMPHMLNPDQHFISHANNLPVGSWYPFDLAIGTGGVGHSSRSWRLVQLLSPPRLFSVDSFESDVHRDDVEAAVAALFPIARRLVEQAGVPNRQVEALLRALENWDLHYRASDPAYPAAMALASALLPPFRRSRLAEVVGGGSGGICHLARVLDKQYGSTQRVPQEPEVRAYLLEWLGLAAQTLAAGQVPPTPRDGSSRDVHSMPYQENGPMGLPVLAPEHNLVSPPLSCGQVGTIWSQKGNSYTQIVDLSSLDRSRAVLPPGISEDPESPYHADQIELWVAGKTRPAPLSRSAVELLARERLEVAVKPYAVPSPQLLTLDGGLAAAVVQRVRPDGSQIYEPAARYNAELARWEALPVEFRDEAEQVYLLLFGTGLRYRSSLLAVHVILAGQRLAVTYAGPQGTYPELDQVNVLLPRSLAGSGEVDVRLVVDGQQTNSARLVFR